MITGLSLCFEKMSTTEKMQMKLSDSKSARWTALLIVSITMMFGYFLQM